MSSSIEHAAWRIVDKVLIHHVGLLQPCYWVKFYVLRTAISTKPQTFTFQYQPNCKHLYYLNLYYEMRHWFDSQLGDILPPPPVLLEIWVAIYL